MGSAASAGLKASLSACSADELTAVIGPLLLPEKEKLKKAIEAEEDDHEDFGEDEDQVATKPNCKESESQWRIQSQKAWDFNGESTTLTIYEKKDEGLLEFEVLKLSTGTKMTATGSQVEFDDLCKEQKGSDVEKVDAAIRQLFTGEEKQVLFICGKPCSGKTFTGDYLATKGWHHVDGDLGNKCENEDTRKKFQALMQGTGVAGQGQPVPENQWKDYYEILVAKVKEGQKIHDKVVLSFSVMGIFEGEVEYMKSHFPGIMFVAVQCDDEILLDRWCVRMKKWFELAKVDTQELWQQPQYAFMHQYAGKDFSWEAYRAWAKACVIGNPVTKLKPDPANNCYEVRNDDLKNNEAIQGLNKILGIPDGPVDTAAIEKVDEARAATIKNF